MIEFFQNPESLNILGLLAIFSGLVLIILGLSHRIVIYNDGIDLSYSFGIVVIPIITMIYIATGSPPEAAGEAAQAAYYSQTWINVALFASLLGSLACAASTAWISIRENGPLIGIPVAALKIATATIALFLIAFWIFSKAKQGRSIWSTLLVAGLIGWFMALLVNGDKVRRRRLSL